MKISICIPVYNFDVRELIEDLQLEIEKNHIPAEIILIDDSSSQEFKKINAEKKASVKRYVELEKNVGRSQIRNLFLYYAKGDCLLFLDCDGKIIDPNFLKKYDNYLLLNPKNKVIFGGRSVSNEPKDKEHELRWKFAIERENLPVEKRCESPYLSFQTNNFLIKRGVLEKINFNPEFQKYGYEDLLFAMDLKHRNIEISHLHNPIFNNDVETNEVYLKKVEESAESLAKMLKNKNTAYKLSEVKLVKAFHYLNKSGGKKWFSTLFSLRKEKTRTKLLSGNVSLRYLDFYKLGLLVENMQ